MRAPALHARPSYLTPAGEIFYRTRSRLCFTILEPVLKAISMTAGPHKGNSSGRKPLYLTMHVWQPPHLLLDPGAWHLLPFRGRLQVAPGKVHLDRTYSVYTIGDSARLSSLRANVSVGTKDLGAHDVAIPDAGATPTFDGLFGFAGMGFHRVSFDFEKQLFSRSDLMSTRKLAGSSHGGYHISFT